MTCLCASDEAKLNLFEETVNDGKMLPDKMYNKTTNQEHHNSSVILIVDLTKIVCQCM